MLSGQAVLGGQRALCKIAMQLPPQWIFSVVLVTLLSHKFIRLTSENLRFDVFFCKKMSAPTTLGGCALFLFFAGVLVIFPAGHTGKEDAVLAVLVAYPVAAHEAESLHQALIASLAGKPLLIVQLGVVHHRSLGIHRERGGAQAVANLLNVCFIHIRSSVQRVVCSYSSMKLSSSSAYSSKFHLRNHSM